MRRTVIIATFALVLASFSFVAPAVLSDGGDHDPIQEQGIVSPLAVSDRYQPRTPGVEHTMSFYYGPFSIPPGQDMNRVTVDVPVHNGFLTSVQANVYDALSSETPSNQDMHIHHAHWFRTSEDPNDEYYTANLAWVFGTGEERTKGDINMRSEAEGEGGPSYGIFIEQGQPQALIYMLHNKNAEVRNVYVALDVKFVYGTADSIAAADGCGDLFMEEGDVCRAGEDFHHVYGTLWGNTYDVPRDFQDPFSKHIRGPDDTSSLLYTSSADGIAIGSAGHLHPNGEKVVIANLGPEGSGCEADLDGDGYPGVTLFYSDKIEDEPAAWPHSEEYQMGVTKPGWRAPVHEGDRIAQYGVYQNGEYASYEAMSYTGLYVDRQQDPGDFDSSLCTTDPAAAAQALGATLIDDPNGDPLETIRNHELHDGDGHSHSHGYCGIEGWPDCNDPVESVPEGDTTDTIHIADFAYIPGDQNLASPLGAAPKIVQGEPLTVVNEDVGLGVRHTLTTCSWPCNGEYVANYPQPDGELDTGKLGNLDYIDGGAVQNTGDTPIGYGPTDDAYPVIDLDTSELEPGYYSFYCRIHPWMRGWFEVVEPSA